jgi:hypothetical protein
MESNTAATNIATPAAAPVAPVAPAAAPVAPVVHNQFVVKNIMTVQALDDPDDAMLLLNLHAVAIHGGKPFKNPAIREMVMCEDKMPNGQLMTLKSQFSSREACMDWLAQNRTWRAGTDYFKRRCALAWQAWITKAAGQHVATHEQNAGTGKGGTWGLSEWLRLAHIMVDPELQHVWAALNDHHNASDLRGNDHMSIIMPQMNKTNRIGPRMSLFG